MRSQPHVKQKDVADAVGITVQASLKILQETDQRRMLDGWLRKSRLQINTQSQRETSRIPEKPDGYVNAIKSDLKIERLLPALATKPVKEGEKVGIIMKEGVLHAVAPNHPDAEAFGIASTDAQRGEDVGLKDLRGKVKSRQGQNPDGEAAQHQRRRLKSS